MGNIIINRKGGGTKIKNGQVVEGYALDSDIEAGMFVEESCLSQCVVPDVIDALSDVNAHVLNSVTSLTGTTGLIIYAPRSYYYYIVAYKIDADGNFSHGTALALPQSSSSRMTAYYYRPVKITDNTFYFAYTTNYYSDSNYKNIAATLLSTVGTIDDNLNITLEIPLALSSYRGIASPVLLEENKIIVSTAFSYDTTSTFDIFIISADNSVLLSYNETSAITTDPVYIVKFTPQKFVITQGSTYRLFEITSSEIVYKNSYTVSSGNQCPVVIGDDIALAWTHMGYSLITLSSSTWVYTNSSTQTSTDEYGWTIKGVINLNGTIYILTSYTNHYYSSYGWAYGNQHPYWFKSTITPSEIVLTNCFKGSLNLNKLRQYGVSISYDSDYITIVSEYDNTTCWIWREKLTRFLHTYKVSSNSLVLNSISGVTQEKITATKPGDITILQEGN